MACFLQAAILDHMWTWRSHSFGVLPGSWRKTSSFLRHSSFVGSFTSILDAIVAIERFTTVVFLLMLHDRSALSEKGASQMDTLCDSFARIWALLQ